ncbi:MAG: hypothetical protein IAF94_06290 [Pirellulaceae bacterium]|nr:hypothetical protein [Pirellulaceae bacterium]
MPKLLRQISLLLLLALVPAGAAGLFHPRRPAWQSDEIVAGTAESWGEKVIWVDARPPAEFESGHIPGALSLNEEAWDASLPPLLDAWAPEKIVVVYCSTLSCQASHEVAHRLRDEVGLKEVRVLQGGWEAWRRLHP